MNYEATPDGTIVRNVYEELDYILPATLHRTGHHEMFNSLCHFLGYSARYIKALGMFTTVLCIYYQLWIPYHLNANTSNRLRQKE